MEIEAKDVAVRRAYAEAGHPCVELDFGTDGDRRVTVMLPSLEMADSVIHSMIETTLGIEAELARGK